MANPNIVSVATINGVSLGWNLTNTLTTTLLTVTSEYVIKINRISLFKCPCYRCSKFKFICYKTKCIHQKV